jgi:glycerol-3-phosphate acyltransferase PlsY
MLYLGGPVNALLASLLALMIFIMHRKNIARLSRGEEPRIGGTKPLSS